MLIHPVAVVLPQAVIGPPPVARRPPVVAAALRLGSHSVAVLELLHESVCEWEGKVAHINIVHMRACLLLIQAGSAITIRDPSHRPDAGSDLAHSEVASNWQVCECLGNKISKALSYEKRNLCPYTELKLLAR